jgi:hypothetical protein
MRQRNKRFDPELKARVALEALPRPQERPWQR